MDKFSPAKPKSIPYFFELERRSGTKVEIEYRVHYHYVPAESETFTVEGTGENADIVSVFDVTWITPKNIRSSNPVDVFPILSDEILSEIEISILEKENK